ncbi:UDP-4-amino-4,6-dideoxy-N-acetyl-beta-L-altrosamine transaminase [Marinicrinis sediminis]|uniref:UDP-4-amino-4, 6-dideoxy-N-acetyl-beta-L-altrosamine transaminase n=1 Tax=Marinicrinis sediminis TaxID=1652465 RepID=A0ABW5RA80_9BACL
MTNLNTLAIHGGVPIRSTMLPYGRQWLDEEDIAHVVDTLRSPYLTQGPAIEAFEQAVAEEVGAGDAIAFANGTAALHAACHVAGITEGDEVITSPITFAASSNCVLYCGGRPVFADIDPQTYNLDPSSVEQAITSRTKAIMAVHFTGQPCDLTALRALTNRYGLQLIEDAAHALGASHQGQPIGSSSNMAMFSFHPVKPVTAGEGGVITTHDESVASQLRSFRSHGIVRDATVIDREGAWYYEMQELGYNYRMTDIQASLGRSQLRKLFSFTQQRRAIAEAYTTAFEQIDGLIVPKQLTETESAWHLYSLQLNPEAFRASRREFFEALRAENIGVHVHYIPVYWHPYYEQLGYARGLCPVAEEWYQHALTLPIFPGMTAEDVNDVIEAVKKVAFVYHK